MLLKPIKIWLIKNIKRKEKNFNKKVLKIQKENIMQEWQFLVVSRRFKENLFMTRIFFNKLQDNFTKEEETGKYQPAPVIN